MNEPLLQIGNLVIESWPQAVLVVTVAFIYLTCNILPSILIWFYDTHEPLELKPMASIMLLIPIIGSLVGAAVVSESPLLSRILGPIMLVLMYMFVGTFIYGICVEFFC